MKKEIIAGIACFIGASAAAILSILYFSKRKKKKR